MEKHYSDWQIQAQGNVVLMSPGEWSSIIWQKTWWCLKFLGRLFSSYLTFETNTCLILIFPAF